MTWHTSVYQFYVSDFHSSSLYALHNRTPEFGKILGQKNEDGILIKGIMPRSISRPPSSYRRRYSQSPVSRRRRRDRSRSPYTTSHNRFSRSDFPNLSPLHRVHRQNGNGR